jgi:hypothetical protein
MVMFLQQELNCRPTQARCARRYRDSLRCAPDGWKSARFQALSVALGRFCQSGIITSHPKRVTQTVGWHSDLKVLFSYE